MENNTHQIFKKHFGKTGSAGIFHPNMESFFEELNFDCRKEDAKKRLKKYLRK